MSADQGRMRDALSAPAHSASCTCAICSTPKPSAGLGVVPFEYAGQSVRTLLVDGEPWFVLADLCRVLDLARGASQVASRLDEGVRQTYPLQTPGGRQLTTIVSEAGMYEVVIRSDKPQAAEFRRWITGTVLPEIRRTGSFNAPPQDRAERFALALIDAQHLLTERDEKIAELEPRAAVADQILNADDDMSVKDAANILARAGIDTGQNRLFNELARRAWIYRRPGDQAWHAYQRAIAAGWVSVMPQSHYHPRSGELVLDPPQIRVRPKGLQKLLAEMRTDAA